MHPAPYIAIAVPTLAWLVGSALVVEVEVPAAIRAASLVLGGVGIFSIGSAWGAYLCSSGVRLALFPQFFVVLPGLSILPPAASLALAFRRPTRVEGLVGTGVLLVFSGGFILAKTCA